MNLLGSVCQSHPFVVGILGVQGGPPPATKQSRLPNAAAVARRLNNSRWKQTRLLTQDDLAKQGRPVPGARRPPNTERLGPGAQGGGGDQQGKEAVDAEYQAKVSDWEWAESVPVVADISKHAARGQWVTVHVFISSTFIDTHGERDVLVKEVFPELNNRLQEHYVRIIPVDLRWGVTHEQAQKIQSVCLNQIDKCSTGSLPWFIGIRTKRYGWVQTSYQSPREFDIPANLLWLKPFDLTKPPGPLSITSMEVYHAFLGKHKVKQQPIKKEVAEPERGVQPEKASRRRKPSVESEVSEEGSESESSSGSGSGSSSGSSSGSEGSESSDGESVESEASEYSKAPSHKEHGSQPLREQGEEYVDVASVSHDYGGQVPRSFFMFRDDSSWFNKLTPDKQWIFDFEYRPPKAAIASGMKQQYTLTDSAQKYLEDLTKVNQAIRDSPLPKRCLDYTCSFQKAEVQTLSSGKLSGFGAVTGLEDFRSFLVEEMSKSLMAEFPSQGKLDAETLEAAKHRAFIDTQARFFVERQELLQRLQQYCEEPHQTVNGDVQTGSLVVVGLPGSGKSALLANFARSAMSQDAIVISHFVGVSQSSTDLHQTLLRICSELKRETFELKDAPIDAVDFVKTASEWISLFAQKASEQHRRVIIIIDGVDQFDVANNPQSATWLPQRLPENVRIILSVREDPVDEDIHRLALLENLRNRHPELLWEKLPVFSRSEQTTFVTNYLLQFHKHLTTDPSSPTGDQLSLLLSKKDAGIALFLIVACDLVRQFGVYERLTGFIDELPSSIPSMFRFVIELFEKENEPAFVRMALSLLACSRSGLLESDWQAILSGLGFGPSSETCNFSRFMAGVRPFLASSGSGYLRFAHSSFLEAVYDFYSVGPKYYDREENLKLHANLAEYYFGVIKKEYGGIPQYNGELAFSEIVYHLIQAKQLDTARHQCLLAMDWLFTRVKLSTLNGVLTDFNMYLQERPRDRAVELVKAALILASVALSIDNRQVSIQLTSRLAGAESRFDELSSLLNSKSWSVSAHPLEPKVVAIAAPGGPEIVRVTKANFPVIANKPTVHMGSAKVYEKPKLCFNFNPEGTISVRTLEGGFQLCELVGHTKEPYGILVFEEEADRKSGAPAALLAVSWGNDNQVIYWNLDAALKGDTKQSQLSVFTDFAGHIHSVHLCKGNACALLTYGDSLTVWDLAASKGSPARYRNFRAHQNKIIGLELLPGAERKDSYNCRAVTYGKDFSIVVWNIAILYAKIQGREHPPGADYEVLKAHTNWVLGVGILNQGRSLMSYSRDGNVIFWDLNPLISPEPNSTAKVVPQVLKAKHKTTVAGVKVFGKDETLAFTWDQSTELFLWDLEIRKGHPEPTCVALIGHVDAIEGVQIFDNGKKAISYGRDRSMNLWHIDVALEHAYPPLSATFAAKPKPKPETFRFPMKGHSDWIEGVVIFKGETRALSYSRDNTLILWDLKSIQDQKVPNLFPANPPVKYKKPKEAAQRGRGAPATRGRGGRGGRGGAVSRGRGRGRSRGASKGSKKKKTRKIMPLPFRPFVKLRGHVDWVKGVQLFRSEQFALSYGGNDLLIWDLGKAERLLLDSITGQQVPRPKSGKPNPEKLLEERLALIPIPIQGHATRIQDLAVFVDMGKDKDNGYHALSIAKDRTVIEWNVDIAQEEGRARERTIRDAIYNAEMEKARLAKEAPKPEDDKKKGKKKDDKSKEKKGEDEGEDADGKASNPLFCVRPGHTKWITGIKLFGDSTRAFTWGKDNTIVLWNVIRQSEDKAEPQAQGAADNGYIMTLRGHTDFVRGVVFFDPSETKLVSWSKDFSIIVWDLAHSRPGKAECQILKQHTDIVLGAKILDDGPNRQILSFSRDKTILLWQQAEAGWNVVHKLEGHEKWIRGANTIAVNNLRFIISWADDGHLKLWDLEKTRQKKPVAECLVSTLQSHSNKIFGIKTFDGENLRSKNVTHIMSFAADSTAVLWNLRQVLREPNKPDGLKFVGHTDWVNGITTMNYYRGRNDFYKLCLSWSRDGSLKLWDLEKALTPVPSVTCIATLQARVGIISGTIVFRDNKRIICWGEDSTEILVWNISQLVHEYFQNKKTTTVDAVTDSSIARFSGFHRRAVTRVSLYAAETRALSFDLFTIVAWDVASRTSLWTITFDTAISASVTCNLNALHEKEEGEEEGEGGKEVRTISHLLIGHTDGQVSQIQVAK